MGVYRRNFRATLELAPKILRGPLAAAIRAKIPPAEGKDPVDQSFKEIFDFRLHTFARFHLFPTGSRRLTASGFRTGVTPVILQP
jgi:hypothetical protein